MLSGEIFLRSPSGFGTKFRGGGQSPDPPCIRSWGDYLSISFDMRYRAMPALIFLIELLVLVSWTCICSLKYLDVDYYFLYTGYTNKNIYFYIRMYNVCILFHICMYNVCMIHIFIHMFIWPYTYTLYVDVRIKKFSQTFSECQNLTNHVVGTGDELFEYVCI